MLSFDEISEHPLSIVVEHHFILFFSAPIYDGRGRDGVPAFDFSPEHFARMESLPIFVDKSGDRDVPAGAVVAVGYSIGTYNGSRGRSLSPNLIFLIVLAVPAS